MQIWITFNTIKPFAVDQIPVHWGVASSREPSLVGQHVGRYQIKLLRTNLLYHPLFGMLDGLLKYSRMFGA